MIGIYKWENLINGKIYIGQSINISKRKHDHELRAFSHYKTNREWDKALYQAMRKYGLNSFSFEVLEECEKEQLNEREAYYIEKYDSWHNGYNETAGGDMCLPPHDGENHPRHKLSEKDVYEIRERYNNHEFKDDVYKDYKDLIGESGFKKIWNGENWNKVHMDVYTQENKDFHKLVRNSHPGKGCGNRLSIEEIKEVRIRKKQGESLDSVFQDFKDKVTRDIFRKVYNYETYSYITV